MGKEGTGTKNDMSHIMIIGYDDKDRIDKSRLSYCVLFSREISSHVSTYLGISQLKKHVRKRYVLETFYASHLMVGGHSLFGHPYIG